MGQNRTSKYRTREFLLKAENHTSKVDRLFYNKALQAYVKGLPTFRFKGEILLTPQRYS